jgi:hypothetical protein
MLVRRISGVFRLDALTFEEIENDRTATGQAALVVTIVAILSATGSGVMAALGTGRFLETFISTLIWAFVGWIVWSAITYLIGTVLFAGRADMGEMLRVIGFASAPLALGIIPCIGGLVGAIWTAAAAFVAIRQGLDLDGGRAFLTMLIGFIVYALGYLSIVVVFGILRMIFGAGL